MGFNDFADQFGTRRPGSDSAEARGRTHASRRLLNLLLKF